MDQYSEMRKLIQERIKRSREDEDSNKGWCLRTIIQIADFAQNLDLPHFGSEQPGDIYYFSPLGFFNSLVLFGFIQRKILSSVSTLLRVKGLKAGIMLL